MVGPPYEPSNMTFASWLDDVLNVTDRTPAIYYHTIQEAEDGLEVMSERRGSVHQPVVIHADILQGPNSEEKPVDPDKYCIIVLFGVHDVCVMAVT